MITLDGNSLTITEIAAVSRRGEKVELSDSSREHILLSRKWIDEIIEKGDPVYGINTGFGCFSNQKINREQTRTLNRNLILSHAVGSGAHFPDEIVRAAMLIRANTLAKGHSGVRLIIINTMLEMLNKNVTPVIPSQGSLGSSGDLAPLSHLALVFTTDEDDLDQHSGAAYFRGELMSGKQAMAAAGIPRIILEAKEGIAINNGATFSAAIAALCCLDAENLLSTAQIGLGLSLEALQGVSAAFDDRIHQARHHPGQIQVAANLRKLIKGSDLIDQTGRVQDAYTLRCGPQVLGPIQETLGFVTEIIQREINAATDNPLLFDDGQALSGGNFHGEPVGLAMDYLAIALTELSGISERRIFRLIDNNLNGDLPSMLVYGNDMEGLNSGVMMPHYTAASLVLENRSLAAPDSIHSLPTSANQEDHNANSTTAARSAYQVIQNSTRVLAIELFTAARAVSILLARQPNQKLGEGTGAVYRKIREHVPFQGSDTFWNPKIDQIENLIRARSLVSD
jgi:histidine ammonia-lyase